MNRNERFVITINRQFGTGGHEIGRVLAETLGVKLIDRQVLQKVARQFNLTEDEAERLEQRRPSWWEDFTKLYRNFVRVNEPMDEGGQVTSRQLFMLRLRRWKKSPDRSRVLLSDVVVFIFSVSIQMHFVFSSIRLSIHV